MVLGLSSFFEGVVLEPGGFLLGFLGGGFLERARVKGREAGGGEGQSTVLFVYT